MLSLCCEERAVITASLKVMMNSIPKIGHSCFTPFKTPGVPSPVDRCAFSGWRVLYNFSHSNVLRSDAAFKAISIQPTGRVSTGAQYTRERC